MQQSQKSNMKKESHEEFEILQGGEPQNIKQCIEQDFKVIQEKLKALSQQGKMYKNTEIISPIQKNLVEEITELINNLMEYLNNFKIYIVVMGTLSSGKSTFINSLLGQQLLPSKNQSCTSQVTYIGHQNTNANQDTKITINGEEFNSTAMASEKLIKLQDQPIGIVNIKTQSHFHKTLNKNLQERVFFIDTPGIELSKVNLEQYIEHLGKILKLIKLDTYSIVIKVWILNYTIFDSDKKLQENLNFITEKEAQFTENQNTANQQKKYIPQKPSSEMFYVINKYDQYNSEDDPEEEILVSIQNVFNNSKNIYRISAIYALRYNIMNYGTEDEQVEFIKRFEKDYKIQFCLKDYDVAKSHCIQMIRNNEDLITSLDYIVLSEKILLEIRNQFINLFKYKLQQLEQVTVFFDQSQKLMNQKEQQFRYIQYRMNFVKELAEKNKNMKDIQLYHKGINTDINQEIQFTEECLNNFKIYIVVMGTLSSGKSTFINSLLGQQLLPSKNQSCTSQVTYIGHQNTNANQDTKITINGEEFNSTAMASEKLIKLQDQPIGIVNIKTQSHFHSTYLRKDLQERVFFIDTPGIDLRTTTSEQSLQKINQLIYLDQCSIRINLWILNYDSEVNELKQNMLKIKKKIEFVEKKQDLSLNFNYKFRYTLNDIQILQPVSFFFIINKFDLSKISVSKAKQKNLDIIKNEFIFDNIFLISAWDTLSYNVMNYGTEDAQKQFLQQFKSKDDVKKHCCNPYLIQLQDFDKFTSKILPEIQKQLDNLINQQIEKLINCFRILEQGEDWIKQTEEKYKLWKIEIDKLQNIFNTNLTNYEQEIIKQNESFFKEIEDLIDQTITQINKKEKQPVIEENCQNILEKIDIQIQHFIEVTKQFKAQLIDQLQSRTKDGQFSIQFNFLSSNSFLILKQTLEIQPQQYKDQLILSQVKHVYDTMSIRSYRASFFESFSIFGLKRTRPQLQISGIIGNQEFASQIADYYFSENYNKKLIDKNELINQMKEWKNILKKNIKKYMDKYIKNYDLAQQGVIYAMNQIEI